MHDFPETSHSLIARVKDLADAGAWAEFLGIYRPVVYRMARRRGMQDADAQDLVQQVFLSLSRAIEKWEPLPGQPPFRAWLTTITRNAITKALTRGPRDVGTGSTSVIQLLAEISVDAETTAELLSESRREAVRLSAEQIRPEFNETTWRLFWETAVQGRPIADVAAESGRSVGAVYMARFRILDRLRQKVQEISHHWEL